jgi:UDP-N-acetylmuramate dehydrogenase
MLSRLSGIPGLQISENVPLKTVTRFGIGGPARLLVDVSSEQALAAAIDALRENRYPYALIGGGTNLIASDRGFPGAVLRYTAAKIGLQGSKIALEAGVLLQDLVDFSIERGLKGLETMTGIPGWVGGAIYGNAGAYGHSIQERVEWVRFFDGSKFREIGAIECDFRYRESVFKAQKQWIVVAAGLRLDAAEPGELRAAADGILKIRNQKYPPEMRCAGSIFKNLILSDLPGGVREQIPKAVIREGKVPSAYFLEQVGAKGMASDSIRVADYHANLIYNSGAGTARTVKQLIETLKLRVQRNYGLVLEEEVQYL